MNPFQKIPIYTTDLALAYSGKRRGDLEPHLFAIAEEAYRGMIREGNNQTVVVSGERHVFILLGDGKRTKKKKRAREGDEGREGNYYPFPFPR